MRFLSVYFSSCQNPSGWQHNPLVYPSLMLNFQHQTCCKHTTPFSRSLKNLLKQDYAQYSSLTYNQELLASKRLCATDHHPLGPTVQTVFNPPACLLIQPIHQLLSADIKGHSVKRLSEVQVHNSIALTSTAQDSDFIIEHCQVDQTWLPLSESLLNTANHIVFLPVPVKSSQDYLFHHLLRD